MQIMGSNTAKLIGGLLLIAGLAALTIGASGIIAGFMGIAAVGATVSAVGAVFLGYSIFSTRNAKTEMGLAESQTFFDLSNSAPQLKV